MFWFSILLFTRLRSALAPSLVDHDGPLIDDPFLLRSGIIDAYKTRRFPSSNLTDLLPKGVPVNTSLPVLAAPLGFASNSRVGRRSEKAARAAGFWMETVPHGQMPLAPQGYKFFRNVKDYGAKGDGLTDDTAAIAAAIYDGFPCGQQCGSSSRHEALVYFPSGTYLISKPIIQLYAMQFVGNPNDRPVIKGSSNFAGFALIDTDPYIPGGNGANWYTNQNNFYRQIRNFILDMTAMPDVQTDPNTHYATFNATGIHWQVAQATSLQYIDFRMPVSQKSHAIGIFMENGSGGFVSDLTFTGGNIGFRAGSQQFTARNLRFKQVNTAISMVWNWGFTWKSIVIENCFVAIDCTGYGGDGGQGTGSISVVDSEFTNVFWAITVPSNGFKPALVIENLRVNNVPSVVYRTDGSTLLGSSGTQTIDTWTLGAVFAGAGSSTAWQGAIPVPQKPNNLLDGNKHWLERSKPHYGGDPPTAVATSNGIRNDGTGDQAAAINNFLKNNVGKVVFFPAGIYLVQDTVFIPVGSRIVGEGWSQIMGTGAKFADAKNPRPIVKVGNAGDSGILEMSDLLFTVKGANPGAILVEWNVHESSPGSAAMWDCHFRVGGAQGSGLQVNDCPRVQFAPFTNCYAASMLMHVTSQASGYFENYVHHHKAPTALTLTDDLDTSNDKNIEQTQISVYVARGFLIESQGPTWWYGTAVEHCQLYQYQLQGAHNVWMGHIQTETPYYQPFPNARQPYTPGRSFDCDPSFNDCSSASGGTCAEAWAVRILGSVNVFVYSAGLYSWFQQYGQACVPKENCQDRLLSVSGNSYLYIFNLFTKGVVEAISPVGSQSIKAAQVQSGYTTQIAAWLLQSGLIFPTISTSLCATNADCPSGLSTLPADNTPPQGPAANPKDSGVHCNLTVINATPYPWTRDWFDPAYMIPDWEKFWPSTINPGETITVRYSPEGGEDMAGDIKYKMNIDGNRHKAFHLRVHGKKDGTKTGLYTSASVYDGLTVAGHGGEDQLWEIGNYWFLPKRTDEGSYDSWILSGNEKDGYTSTDPPTQWMDLMGPRLKQLNFRQIVLPGAHDSGMCTVTGGLGGVFENTGTQSVPIYDQLVRGIRVQDWRVYKQKDQFWLGHFSDFAGGSGGLGQPLDEAIENVNRFNRENPGELIIVQINELRTGKPYGYMADSDKLYIMKRIIEGLDGGTQVYELSGCNSQDVSAEPLQSFYNSRISPVIIRLNGAPQAKGNLNIPNCGYAGSSSTGRRRVYACMTSDEFKITGGYSDSNNATVMRSEQYNNLATRDTQSVFESFMTLTLQGFDNVDVADTSIARLATVATGVLYDSMYRWSRQLGKWPNTIWFDFIDDRQVSGIAMAMNWNLAYKAAGLR